MRKFRLRITMLVCICFGIFMLCERGEGARGNTNLADENASEIEYDCTNFIMSSLADTSECMLCGSDNNSIIHYLCGRNDLGIICLNSWNVLELYIHDPESSEQPIISSLCTGKEGCKISRTNHVSRGIAQVSICLGAESFLDVEKVGKSVCQDCLNRLIEITGNYDLEAEPDKMYDLCLYDFQTKKFYPLQPTNKEYYVRDYYIHIDYSDEHIEVTSIYAPETGREK